MLGIEGASHQLHRLQVGLGKHLGHEHLLFFPDPMFAGNRTASRDAQPQYFGGKFLRLCSCPWMRRS